MAWGDGRSDGRVEFRRLSSAHHRPGTSRRELSKHRARRLEVSKHGNGNWRRVSQVTKKRKGLWENTACSPVCWANTGTRDKPLGWPDCSPLNESLGEMSHSRSSLDPAFSSLGKGLCRVCVHMCTPICTYKHTPTYSQSFSLNCNKPKEMLGSVGLRECILESKGVSCSSEAHYSCVTSCK